MYQTDTEVVVKASMPGINAEDVNISVTGDILSITGETCEEKEVKEENYFRREMRCGFFSRALQVPVPVKVDKAEAVLCERYPDIDHAQGGRSEAEVGLGQVRW